MEKSISITRCIFKSIMDKQDELLAIYKALLHYFGYRYWWPADEPFEVIIGAILAQNVSWSNAKKAIDNLKSNNFMEPFKLYEMDAESIAPLIKSSRYYNQKSQKIKNFVSFFINNYDGDIKKMANEDMNILRNELLEIKGLGNETVDSIILYACEKPIFVVDAYTKRILLRYGLLKGDPTYRDIQSFFMNNIPQDIELYNDFHAQICHLGNMVCKTSPKCDICPIRKIDNNYGCLKIIK